MPVDSTADQPEPAPAAAAAGHTTQVLALGLAQVLAWGSSTYLPAAVVGPVSSGLGISHGMFFAAFSMALVVMAVAGPAVGRRIDRQGGRQVLRSSNLVLAAGLLMLSGAQGITGLFMAWCVMGLGMALGLYDAAFAALVFQHGRSASRLIVGISLVGGFASTLAWPLSGWMVEHGGWRTCCQAWAAAHLGIGLMIHGHFLGTGRARAAEGAPRPPDGSVVTQAHAHPQARPATDMRWLLVFSGSTAFVTSAMAVHLPALLAATGSSLSQAWLAGALLGPAQVAARLAEFGLSQRFKLHPLATARAATALHPMACLVLGLVGALPFAGALFSVLHGAGNGMVSVARGVLPLALFGPGGYGAITGRLALVGRSMQALAPFSFALVMAQWGPTQALWLSGSLSVAAFVSLLHLRR
jgi:MFS family permease